MAEKRRRQVKPGDVLAEIETDKATMEVEAIDEGVLAKILVADGTDNVAVNTPIGVLAMDGEDVSRQRPPRPQRRRRRAKPRRRRTRRLRARRMPRRSTGPGQTRLPTRCRRRPR